MLCSDLLEPLRFSISIGNMLKSASFMVPKFLMCLIGAFQINELIEVRILGTLAGDATGRRSLVGKLWQKRFPVSLDCSFAKHRNMHGVSNSHWIKKRQFLHVMELRHEAT